MKSLNVFLEPNDAAARQTKEAFRVQGHEAVSEELHLSAEADYAKERVQINDCVAAHERTTFL